MRSKNTDLKKEIYDFVNDYKRKSGKSPSLRKIAEAVSVSYNTVHRYLIEMRDKDHSISYDGNTIETRELNGRNTYLSPAKIVGSIPCGPAETEEEYVEDYVNLPAAIFGIGEFYIFRAQGDSMVDAGIEEGDLIVIRRQSDCQVGDIIVALNGDNQNTLKRFGGFDDDQYAVLEYMNGAVYPDEVIRVRELMLQGVACNVIKRL